MIPTLEELSKLADKPHKDNKALTHWRKTEKTTKAASKAIITGMARAMRENPTSLEWSFVAKFSGHADGTQIGHLHMVDLVTLINEQLPGEYHYTLHEPKRGFDEGVWSIACDVFIV